MYYKAKLAAKNEGLLTRIKAIAQTRVHYGYRRITVLLRREGVCANAKRVFRLYRLAELGLRRRRPRRRRSAVTRTARVVASRPNEVWSMDFVHDRLADGRSVRFLTVVDAHTRECVALEVRRAWTGEDVAAALTHAMASRSKPAAITCDNGSEFYAAALDRWAYYAGVKLDYSRPGRPTDNALIESFNALVRRELLNASYFESLNQAAAAAEKWRCDYNVEHPHSSLGNHSPQAFALARIAELERPIFTPPA